MMFINFLSEDLKINPAEEKFLHDYLVFKKIYKPKVEIIYQIINVKYARI